MMVKIFRLLRKSSLMVQVCKFSIKSEAAIHVCTILLKSCSEVLKMSQNENLCMSLSSNKVAGLKPETFFEKGLCTHVFQLVLPNILEHLSCKTRPGDFFCKLSFLFVTSASVTKCYHWTCFFRFTLNIFGTLLFSESPKQLAVPDLIYHWSSKWYIENVIGSSRAAVF